MVRLSEYAAGELPREDAEQVAEHVEGCPDCARDVAALRRLGPLLATMGEGRSIDEVDHTFALARAGARAARDGRAPMGVPDAAPAPASSRPFWQHRGFRAAIPMAAAAAILLAVGLPRLGGPDAEVAPAPQFTAKGIGGQELRVSLSFSVQEPEKSLALGKNGWKYPPEALLYFRCHLPETGYLLLARIDPEGVEPLSSPGEAAAAIAVPAGAWDLSDGTHLLGYGLDDLHGTQRFVALFSSRPFSLTPALKADLTAGVKPGELLRRHALVMDELTVEVAGR